MERGFCVWTAEEEFSIRIVPLLTTMDLLGELAQCSACWSLYFGSVAYQCPLRICWWSRWDTWPFWIEWLWWHSMPFPFQISFHDQQVIFSVSSMVCSMSEWGAYVIVHTILPPSPVILWIELGDKPKWLPLNLGYDAHQAPVPRLTVIPYFFNFLFVAQWQRAIQSPVAYVGKEELDWPENWGWKRQPRVVLPWLEDKSRTSPPASTLNVKVSNVDTLSESWQQHIDKVYILTCAWRTWIIRRIRQNPVRRVSVFWCCHRRSLVEHTYMTLWIYTVCLRSVVGLHWNWLGCTQTFKRSSRRRHGAMLPSDTFLFPPDKCQRHLQGFSQSLS